MGRLFQKPKANGKMPLSSNIFRDPKELEALKSKVKPEEYLKVLYENISKVENDLEAAEKKAILRKEVLENEFQHSKREKEALIGVLDNTLELKRQKRDEAEVPILDRIKQVELREQAVLEREKQIPLEQQRTFERERETQRKLEDVQNLSDELGEIRVRLTVKEKFVAGKEASLKDKETEYMLKIDRFSHEVNEAAARIQERENAVQLKELNVQGKEENLVKREKELLDGHILLNDQRGTLARAWKELKDKQNGKSRTSHIAPTKRS